MEVMLEISTGTTGVEWVRFHAPTIEVARLLAASTGYNCDLEPGAPGAVKLTATRDGVTITVNGKNVNDAAEKLVRKLTSV